MNRWEWELIGNTYVNRRNGYTVSKVIVNKVYDILGEEWMSLREISRRSGYSYSTVFRAVEVLKEGGLVERRRCEKGKGWIWRKRVG